MREKDIAHLLKQDAELSALLRDICEFVMPESGEKHFNAATDMWSAPIDAFIDAYKNSHIYETYDDLRILALLKLIHIANVDKALVKGRSKTMHNHRVTTMTDLVKHVVQNFEVFVFEKLLLFRISSRGGITCVYESKSNDEDRCGISTDELNAILSRNDGASFVLVHSHPCGELEASDEDCISHEYIKRVFSLTKCRLIDHVIIGKEDGDTVYITLDEDVDFYYDKTLAELCKR